MATHHNTFNTGVKYSATPRAVPFTVFKTLCIILVFASEAEGKCFDKWNHSKENQLLADWLTGCQSHTNNKNKYSEFQIIWITQLNELSRSNEFVSIVVYQWNAFATFFFFPFYFYLAKCERDEAMKTIRFVFTLVLHWKCLEWFWHWQPIVSWDSRHLYTIISIVVDKDNRDDKNNLGLLLLLFVRKQTDETVRIGMRAIAYIYAYMSHFFYYSQNRDQAPKTPKQAPFNLSCHPKKIVLKRHRKCR